MSSSSPDPALESTPPATSAVAPIASAPRPRRRSSFLLVLFIILGVGGLLALAGFAFQSGKLLGAVAYGGGAVGFLFLAPLGWFLGDKFRTFAMPSFYFGAGAMDMAKRRLFWMVGPQSVGVLCVFAAFVFIGFVVSNRLPGPSAAPAQGSVVVSTGAPSGASAAVAAPAEPASATGPVSADTAAASTDGGPAAEPTLIAQLPPVDAPMFARYQTPIYAGPITLPDFAGRDRDYVGVRTRITDGANAGPNFAGRFALVTFGCGTECSAGYVVDEASGQVYSLPLGGEENLDLSLQFVKDSALLRAEWNHQDEQMADRTCVHQDFVWTGSQFQAFGQSVDAAPC